MVMLYVFMFLTMIVGLYISRAVLAVMSLGDYGTDGTYGVVGGIVAMIEFLNCSEMVVGAA